MDQDILNLVCLLDLDADPDTVDAGFNEYPLVLVSGDDQGRKKDLGRCAGFDLGYIVTFGCL